MVFPPTTLALDFGTKRIGVAVSRGSLAEPLMIIPHDAAVIPNILKVITEEEIQQLVVGLSENNMAEQTQAFVDKLRQATSLPIEFVDETLSSYTSHQKQLDRGLSLSKRQEPVDHLAAAEFLQEWLDAQLSISP